MLHGRVFQRPNAGRCRKSTIKPVNKTDQIDGRSDGQVLQMRFCHSHIPGTAQVKGSQSISLLEGFGTLSLSCGLLGLWPDDERSRGYRLSTLSLKSLLLTHLSGSSALCVLAYNP